MELVYLFLAFILGIGLGAFAVNKYWEDKIINSKKDFCNTTNSFPELMKRLEEEYSDDC